MRSQVEREAQETLDTWVPTDVAKRRLRFWETRQREIHLDRDNQLDRPEGAVASPMTPLGLDSPRRARAFFRSQQADRLTQVRQGRECTVPEYERSMRAATLGRVRGGEGCRGSGYRGDFLL